MPAEREPDAAPQPAPAGREPARALGALGRGVLALVAAALRRPARALGGAVEHLDRADALAQDLPGRRHVAGHDRVAAAQLERVQAQFGRDAVHVALHRELGLRRAEAAERPVGRRVGRHAARADLHVGAAVGPGRVERAPREHHRRERHVGAAVHHHVHVGRDQRAVAPVARAHADDGGMAFRGGGDVLEAVVDELDRPAALPRQQRGVRADHRRVVLLAPEPATRDRLDHAHLLRRQGEHALQGVVHEVGALERAAHHDAALGGALGDHAVVLDVELLLVPAAVDPLDHEIRVRETRHEVAVRDVVLLEEVVLAVDLHPRRERVLDREHGVERLDLDAHGTQGGLGALGIGVRQQQDGLVRVLDLAHDQERLVLEDVGHAVLARDVPVIGDHHAVPVEGRVEFDAADEAARNLGAHGAAVEHPGDLEVVHVKRAPGDLVGAVALGDVRADRRLRPERGPGPGTMGLGVTCHRAQVTMPAAGGPMVYGVRSARAGRTQRRGR